MSNKSINSAPPIKGKVIKEIDAAIRKSCDEHGLVNYLDCCFQECESAGDPVERVESALEGLKSDERTALIAFIAGIKFN